MALNSHSFILTIAIPTYNRANYLDRALKSIYNQIIKENYSIEIIVSNNCSTDNTDTIVENYIKAGLVINYIKNDENKGASFNIVQCYKRAQGQYVLIFGDDDIFNIGAIKRIISILESYNDIGLFYLNWRIIDSFNNLKSSISEVTIYFDYSSFFEEVRQSITFISGIIVNSRYISQIDFDKYLDTSLPQVPLLLKAAFSAQYNIIHKEALISVQPENSGGYSFRQVFGKNLQFIFDEFNTEAKRDKIFNNIQERLLMENFPVWIYRTKTQIHTYVNDSNAVLIPVFSKFYHYWLFVYPVIIMPASIIKILWPIYRIYKVALRLIVLGLKPKSNVGKKIVKLRFD